MSDDENKQLRSMADDPPTPSDLKPVTWLKNMLRTKQVKRQLEAEAELYKAGREVMEARTAGERARLELDKQFAVNQAYHYPTDVKMHERRAELEEIRLAEKLEDANNQKEVRRIQREAAVEEAEHEAEKRRREREAEFQDPPRKISAAERARRRKEREEAEEQVRRDELQERMQTGATGPHMRRYQEGLNQYLEDNGYSSFSELPEDKKADFLDIEQEMKTKDLHIK